MVLGSLSSKRQEFETCKSLFFWSGRRLAELLRRCSALVVRLGPEPDPTLRKVLAALDARLDVVWMRNCTDPLEARKEAQRDAAARMDAVYLYGVDTMSTKDCLAYFEEYGPRFVEWIDDSSCARPECPPPPPRALRR